MLRFGNVFSAFRPLDKTVLLLLVAGTFTSCAVRRKRESSVALSEGPTLTTAVQEKLAVQFQLYTRAREILLEKVNHQNGLMTRQEWETILTPGASEQIDASDRLRIQTFHNELAEKAKADAIEASVIDLNKVREERKARAFCEAMPKGGMLHVHPYGTLDESTVRKILEEVNPPLVPGELAGQLVTPGTPQGILYDGELEWLRSVGSRYGEGVKFRQLSNDDKDGIVRLFFLPEGAHSFDRFNGVFTVISKWIFANSHVDPEPIMFDGFFRRAKKTHLSYVEVTTFTKPSSQWIPSLVTWAKKVKQDYGIEVRLLAAFNRTKTPAFTKTKAKQLLDSAQSPILAGVNLLADESNTPALEVSQTLYAPILEAVQGGRSALHRSIHAGELGDPRNVRDALIMGVERIGHGVTMRDDPVILEYMRQRRIGIEVNILSNYRLKVINQLNEHPVVHYLRIGLPVSLATDDEGIFKTTIVDDCVAVVENSDVSYAEMAAMARNSLTVAFLDEATRSVLMSSLNADLRRFEETWNSGQNPSSPPSPLQ